jgi:hypothetical protein
VTKNVLSLAPLCFGRHVKPLVPAAFAGRVVRYGPFPLCVIHKEGMCPSSENINRQMLMYVMAHSGDEDDIPSYK